MKYIGENAIKKLISLIKGDLATKQPTITASGLLKGDGAGTVTAADTQEATLVDVPNGLLKGDGTTISAAVVGTDYMVPPTGGTTGQVLKKTETGTEWADGKSAYQSAVEAGYSGTETAFNTALSNVPGHIADASIHVTAEEKAAWNDSDVFIATYGTTTSAEIEAAYQAGKILYCETGDWIGQYTNRISSSQFVFIFNRPEAIYTATVSTSSITGVTTWTNEQISYTPKTHASTHASGGSDPITPADIGAATMDEVNAAIQAAIGNAIGGSY